MTGTTFIICNYNYGEYISRAVESVVNQLNFSPDNELIIYDDFSSDNSRGVINSLKFRFEKRFSSFKIIFSKKRNGKLFGLNKCIPLINNKFTVILDADDILFNNYISRLITEYHKSSDKYLGFIYTDCILIDSNEFCIANGISSKFQKDLIQLKSYIPDCALTLSNALKSGYPYDKEITVSTKHHKWKRIVGNNWKGQYLPNPLFYYRMHEKNMSGIGRRVLELKNENSERLLTGYWN